MLADIPADKIRFGEEDYMRLKEEVQNQDRGGLKRRLTRLLYVLDVYKRQVEEAQALYQDALKAIAVRRTEKIPVEESLGRMTAKAIYARCCSPLFNAAAMDGIAVIAKETAGATQENPLTLVRGKDYQIVDTGDPVHPPYDAVIMAEDLLEAEEDVVQIMEAASGWQHVRPIGCLLYTSRCV